MLTGLADALGFSPELLHNLKTVVSEACNNVVLHAYNGEPGRLMVDLEIARDGVEAVVRDWGCGIRYVVPAEDRMHVGLAVITALTDRAQFLRAPGGGTEVRMAFDGPLGLGTFAREYDTCGHVAVDLSGDAVATLSPAGLLDGVLARVATTVAASARFTLDRFCDVYLVTDAVAAHAEASAVSDELGFALAASDRRLDLTLGPFRDGSGAAQGRNGAARLGSALSLLAVDLAVEPILGGEMWHLVVLDRNGGSPAAAVE
jgi:serine/threonine-protein kinase RsbW